METSDEPVDTRENILRLAARLFGTQGYSATTMRSIADLAGIEAASIYYHFSSKEELVDVVMSHGAECMVREISEHFDALPADANAERRFRAMLMGQASALVKFGDYAQAHGRLLAQLPDKVRERHIERRERHQKRWNALLQGLRSEGHLRPDVNLALCRVFILGAINTIQTWFDPKKNSLDDVVDQLCTVFFEGVRCPGAAVAASDGKAAETASPGRRLRSGAV